MVTATHEASHRLFQEHPEALAPVFEALGLPPPAKTDFHELSPDTTEIRPVERRADTVLMFEPDMGEHFVLAVEAQTKKDPEKARNWAYYVSYLRAKYDLPVLLVAVCRDPSTAAWAMGPFECSVGPWTGSRAGVHFGQGKLEEVDAERRHPLPGTRNALRGEVPRGKSGREGGREGGSHPARAEGAWDCRPGRGA
ncbi:hypothetical protein ACWIG2_10150 [Streptomyces cellulosae]